MSSDHHYLLKPVLSPLAIFIVLAIIGAILGFFAAVLLELLSSRCELDEAEDGAPRLAFLLKELMVPFFSCARLTPRGGLATEST